MTDNMQRARELLAAEYEKHGRSFTARTILSNPERVGEDFNRALRAIAAALRLAVPEPTDDMVEAGRTAVMALECSGPKWTVRQHYEASGADPSGIPDELLDMICPMPKAARAELIYRAMLASAPTVSAEGEG